MTTLILATLVLVASITYIWRVDVADRNGWRHHSRSRITSGQKLEQPRKGNRKREAS